MKNETKKLFNKMVDYKTYATILLAVGAFFYLGVVIPNVAQTTISQLAGLGGSLLCLLTSILFFYLSKKLRTMLEEIEDGQDFLSKK